MFGAHLTLVLSFHVVHSLFLRLPEEIEEQPGKILKRKLIGISKYAAEIIYCSEVLLLKSFLLFK